MNINEFLGYKIKYLRKKSSFSEKEFAQLLDISELEMKKIESGEIDISVFLFFKISKILKTTPSKILSQFND